VDEPTAPAPASVTLQDIADACGVTRATVSRALRGSPGVSELVRARIVATAERIGYRPNRIAQGLRNRRSHLVGLILTNLVNASFQTITEVMQARLDAEGYQTILSVSGGRLDQEERLLSMLFERQVDGVVMLGSDGQVPLSPLVRDAPVPVVHLVRRLDPQPPDSVLARDRDGAAEATAHLIALGHTRIALVVGKNDTHVGNERRRGYLQALRQAGIKPDRSIIVEGAYAPETGTRAVQQLFSRPEPPTALLIANHEAAFGALPALVERRIDIPKQVSVIVYEDAPWFAYWGPPLTVVDNQPVALADAAVSLLLARLHHEAAPPVGGRRPYSRLIVRSSCASPPEASLTEASLTEASLTEASLTEAGTAEAPEASPTDVAVKPVPRPRRRAPIS
jgi:LacI family transcriptional regulator